MGCSHVPCGNLGGPHVTTLGGGTSGWRQNTGVLLLVLSPADPGVLWG